MADGKLLRTDFILQFHFVSPVESLCLREECCSVVCVIKGRQLPSPSPSPYPNPWKKNADRVVGCYPSVTEASQPWEGGMVVDTGV